MTRDSQVLELFSPQTRSWFGDRLGKPTEVQLAAWPQIAAGEHVLVTAPTGSGKTLAAFLWALDRLLTGAWDAGSPVGAGPVAPSQAAAASTRPSTRSANRKLMGVSSALENIPSHTSAPSR